LATNAGAPTQQEVAVVDRTIDPKGELPPELREIARHNAIYQYWSRRGEPQKADRAAWQMLQASKAAASQYGAAALAVDDPVKRAEVIAKGYNQLVPDGNTVKITGKSGNGAKFEMYDNQGRLTEKGVLAVDDMVQMATGMQNGTAYLQSLVQFATAAPGAAEKKAETERRSIEEFSNTLDREQQSDYQSTLNEDQRRKFLAMPSRAQNQVVREWQRDRKQAFDEFKFEERMQKGAEQFDRKEALDIAKFSTRYGMWERTRDQVMTQAERTLAQREQEEAGRNKRFDQSQTARDKRNREIDQRILDKRTAGRDGAGVRLTAKERAANAAEQGRIAGEEAVRTGIEEAVPLPRGVSEGTAEEARSRAVETAVGERIGSMRAETGFQAGRERAAKLGGKAQVDWEGTATAFDEFWKASGGKKIAPAERTNMIGIAGGIASGNDIPPDAAIELALAAREKNNPIRFIADPSDPRMAQVRIGNSQPLRVGSDTLNLIALARGGSLTGGAVGSLLSTGDLARRERTNPPPRAATALPGITGNPTPAQRRQRALDIDMLESGMLNPTYRP